MRSVFNLFTGLLLLAGSFVTFVAGEDDTVHILAQYTETANVSEAIALMESYDVDGNLTILVEVYRVAAIEIPADDEDMILEELKANELIENALGDLVRRIPDLPKPVEIVEDDDEGDDSGRRKLKESTEYGIKQTQADQLYDIADEAPGKIDVCIVDTGIEDGHEDLPNSIDNGLNGTDGFTITALSGVWDNEGNGHGTHCAGVIGAIGDNKKGVVGVRKNPDLFKFMIGKGLSDLGAGSTSNIMKAMAGCYNSGAKVISMSLGGPVSSGIEDQIYRFLYDEGFLVVAAAGNAGDTTYSFPASYDTVLSVAAIDKKENWATFSQRNNQVELAAPGVDIKSTYIGNKYAKLSGTSMACPHVAGIAAEVWSHFPDCTNNQIRNVLLKTAKDLGQKGYDGFYGYGLVQGKDAYDLLKSEGCEAGGSGGLGALGGTAKGGCQQIENDADCDNLDLTDPDSGVASTSASLYAISGIVLILAQFFM